MTINYHSQYRKSSSNGNNIVTSSPRKTVLLSSQLPSVKRELILTLSPIKFIIVLEWFIKKFSRVLHGLVYKVCSNRNALLSFSPFAYLRKYWLRISAAAQRGLAKFHAVCEECLRLQSSRHVRRLDALPAGCQSGPCTALPAPCSSSPHQEH